MSLRVFSPRFLSSVSLPTIFCFFPLWSGDRNTDCAYIGTRTNVGHVRRDLWMFLYKAYFVWLPIMYFQCTGCAHLCLGRRSLGRAVVNCELTTVLLFLVVISFPHVAYHACISGSIWASMMGRTASISIYPTETRKQADDTLSFDVATAVVLLVLLVPQKQVDATGRNNLIIPLYSPGS